MAKIELNAHVNKLVGIAKRIATSNPRLSKELNATALKMADTSLIVTVDNYLPLLTEASEAGDEPKMRKLIKELAAAVGN